MAVAKGKGDAGKGIDAHIDELYQLPVAEFTAARNALAGRLKKGGHTEDAERVKALQKPSLTAWAVNQLYWKRRDAYDRLIAAGERFRKAQASQLAGKPADIREPLEARRTALAEMSKLAAATLRQAGSNPTPDTMRRITTTLEALSTYGALPDAPRAGRLSDDVDPPGFEALSALVPRIGGPGGATGPTRIIAFHQQKKKGAKDPRRKKGTPEEEAEREAEERKAQRAAAKAALQEAERALREARKAAQKAEEALKEAAARAKEAEHDKAEAERRFEQASADADAARQTARKVAADAEEAAQAVEDAERALDKATAELSGLEET